jgi:hypothetical protein
MSLMAASRSGLKAQPTRRSSTRYIKRFAETLAGDPAVLKLRLHLPDVYDNAKPAPPAPHVGHTVPAEREHVAILELAFANPLSRRTFYAGGLFRGTLADQAVHISHATAFAVSGVYTYVRDKQLTVAGLRGSRPAQLIETLGATNQVANDVRTLFFTGTLQA